MIEEVNGGGTGSDLGTFPHTLQVGEERRTRKWQKSWVKGCRLNGRVELAHFAHCVSCYMIKEIKLQDLSRYYYTALCRCGAA